MSQQQRDDAMLRQLAILAREDSPPELAAADADAMVRMALGEAEVHRARAAREPARRSERGAKQEDGQGEKQHPQTQETSENWRLWAGAAVAVAAAALLAMWLGGSKPETPVARGESTNATRAETTAPDPANLAAPEGPTPESGAESGSPVNVELPTGDRLLAAAGARFDVESVAPQDRIVRLSAGTMLFEVVRLGDEQKFQVNTEHADIRVLGTVFSVEATDSETIVRVFEGRVEVRMRARSGEQRVEVSANEQVSTLSSVFSAGVPARRGELSPLDLDANLSDQGVRAALIRRGEPVRRVQEQGHVEPEAAALAPEPVVAREVTPVEARGWIAHGGGTRALAAANAALRTTEAGNRGAWRMVKADAERALGQTGEAIDSYLSAASSLGATQRFQAAYLAASLQFASGSPSAAIDTLDLYQVDRPGAPLEERALGLRVRAMHQSGGDLTLVSERYLSRFPRGGLVRFVRSVRPGARPE